MHKSLFIFMYFLFPLACFSLYSLALCRFPFSGRQQVLRVACIGQAILARSWRLWVFVQLLALPACHGKPQCENCENGKWHERIYYCNRRQQCSATFEDNDSNDAADDDGNNIVGIAGWPGRPGERDDG